MQVLVLGTGGLLGSNVVAAAGERGWEIHGTYHSKRPAFDIPLYQLDITDDDALKDTITRVSPDWIVNCAAMTDVDGCEENPDRAYNVNADAPGTIATLCAAESIGYLHVSTDYIFGGTTTEPYTEDSTTNPIQEYGASKLAGEQQVRGASGNALIARLSFVYGIHRGTGELSGFPAWVRGRLLNGEETPLFTDQHITPTRAGQAADTFCDLINVDKSGTYHVAARSCVTPYEFGSEIADRLGVGDGLLEEGSQSTVKRKADRPSHTCLDVSRVEKALDRVQPTLTEDLDAISRCWMWEGP